MVFHYKQSKKKTLIILASNMLVIAVYFFLFEMYKADIPQLLALSDLMAIIVIGIELILLLYFLWYLMIKGDFVINVSKDRFQILHPTANGFCIDVNPSDISQIKHTDSYSSDGRYLQRRLLLKNGDSFAICPNYSYSISEMYSALNRH
jgi:hypothetical protein